MSKLTKKEEALLRDLFSYIYDVAVPMLASDYDEDRATHDKYKQFISYEESMEEGFMFALEQLRRVAHEKGCITYNKGYRKYKLNGGGK